jgi:cation:H+ antiporter
LEQTLIASLAVVMTGLAGLLIVARQSSSLFHIGIGTGAIAVMYVFGMRVVFRQESMRRRGEQLERVVEKVEVALDRRAQAPLKRAAWGFAAGTLGILIAAPLLAQSAMEIAEITGISSTFIGTSLVGIVTSLPELVTTFAAVRLGAFDLAVGNLFGSNAFNMAILFIADMAYWKGPLLAAVEPAHAVTALVGIVLMSVGNMGLIYRAEKRFLLIEPDSALMILGYVLGMGLIFSIS